MNRTLLGLAILNYNWQQHNKDIIDSYIPIVCSAIRDNGLTSITNEVVQDIFNENLGLKIPLGAIETILRRMVKSGLLNREGGAFNVKVENVYAEAKHVNSAKFNSEFNEIIEAIGKFSQNEFDVPLDAMQVSDGLILFLKENHLDLILSLENGNGILPEIKESKKLKYIIAKYITQVYEKEYSKFEIILRIAQGYTIASLISYKDTQNYFGKLSQVDVYLDAPILFNLLGLNGEASQKLSAELIDILIAQEAKLKIFETNYFEVINTLQDAVNRLRTNNYNLAVSSRVLRTAVQKGLSSSAMEIKLTQVDGLLTKYNVTKTENPPLTHINYQIGDTDLTQIIAGIYNPDGGKLPEYKMVQIDRDVQSISNIFKIRKDHIAINIKSCKAIFLTSNETIAYAARKYEKRFWKWSGEIPVCITDIFLSTLLWVNYPAKSDTLNIRRIMSECHSILEIDSKLLAKYYKDVEVLHNENAITDEHFYLLSASRTAFNLLEKKTLNDLEEYTDKTPQEILNEMLKNRDATVVSQKARLDKVESNILFIAKFASKSFFIVIALIVGLLALLAKFAVPTDWNIFIQVPFYILATLIALFGILRWAEVIPTKNRIESWIESLVFTKLKGIFLE